MAILGVETGSFNGSLCGAFTESPLHARGNNIITLPSNNFGFLRSNGGLLASQAIINNDGTPFPPTYFPYARGQYQMGITIGGSVPSDGNIEGSLLFLNDGWLEVPIGDENGVPTSQGTLQYAPWGTPAVIRYLRNCNAGKWSGGISNFIFATVLKRDGDGNLINVQAISMPSSTAQIVSADGQIVDVTPAGFNSTTPTTGVPLSFDSVALFGRKVPFFPQLTIAGIPDPNLTQYHIDLSNPGQPPNFQQIQVLWGPSWGSNQIG
jgi:hypothetical protein